MHKNIIPVGILAALLCGCSENERLRIVAQNGNAAAAFELSQRYAKGRDGCPMSAQKSLKWLRIAADKGNAAAQVICGQLICPKDDLITAEACDIAKVEAARAWYEKAARQGNIEGGQWLISSDLVLITIYRNIGAKKRVEEIKKDMEYWATWCWEKALKMGDQSAAALIANLQADRCILSDGSLLSDGGSDEKEFLWRSRAAEMGNCDAQFKLARMYFKGRGCEKSTEKALSWLEKAASQGHAEAKRFMDSLQSIGSIKKGDW